MGLFSAVAKIAKSAVKAVSGSSVSSALSKAKRVVKAAPDFVFGTSSNVAVNAMKSTKGSIFTKVKAGAKAVVKDSEKASKVGGNFFKRLYNGVKTLPSALKQGTKAGARAAKIAGKSSVLGGVKGFFKAVGKKMPLIGSLVTVAFEIPNIWNAGKNEGLGTALKETGKAAVRLAGGAAGAVLGTFVGGPVGGVLGYMAGEWLLGKLTGKSYTDKKDFLEECGYKEEDINQLKAQGYSFDDIYNGVKDAVENAQEQIATQPAATQQKQVEQPSDKQQAEQTTTQQPVVSQNTPESGLDPQFNQNQQYSLEEVDSLRQYGFTDEDIQMMQSLGYSYSDAVALINNIKNGGAATPVNTPALSNVYSPNGNSDYIEPFQLPYPTTGFAQSNYYNSNVYSNPYSTDTYYNLLLSNLGMPTTGMSNPFATGNMQYNFTTQNTTNPNYDNLFYQNGRFGYSA